jgi:hypothetical protein
MDLNIWARIAPAMIVGQFKGLGIEYFYYQPDDEFTSPKTQSILRS